VNIAVVGGYPYPLDFSQAARDLRVLRAYRRALGTVVVVVQSPDSERHCWEEDRVIVNYVPRRGPGLVGLATFCLGGFWTTWGLIRRHRLSVADATDLAAAFLLIPLKWLTGVRLLLHLQFQFFEMSPLAFPRWKRWGFRVGAKLACRWADSIRCVTEDVRQQALRAGVAPGKLHVIPTRCDPALFDPARAQRGPRARALVYVGTLTALKGVDVLLDAMPHILRAVPDATLRLIGDGPLRDTLRRRIADAGLERAVSLVGAVPYAAVPHEIGGAAVFVFPSRSEAMPRAVLEAMAMARPVVASRVGGIPEAVRDGVEGLLVPPGDAAALAAAVCRLLTDVPLAAAMGQRGRQRVLERFTFQQNVRALVAWHTAWAAHA
jgi:glycosyltransferase involved in cell wall biosynthesis